MQINNLVKQLFTVINGWRVFVGPKDKDGRESADVVRSAN